MIKPKHVIFFIFAILIIGLTTVWVITNQKFLLEIDASPPGSIIKVNETIIKTTKFSEKLKKGKYKISISKLGYVSKEQEIDLKKDLKLKITLDPIQKTAAEVETYKNIDPFSVGEIVPTANDFLVAIDKKTSYLIKIEKDSKRVLYSRPVIYYSYNFPYVALIERNTTGKIVVLNIETNKINMFENNSLSQIISVALSNDSQKIAFLANYNPKTRESKLFVSEIAQFSPLEKFKTKADKIEYINDETLLLFETKDALDSSEVSLFDLLKLKTTLSTKGNWYSFSPSKNRLLIQSSSLLTLIDTISMQKSVYPFADMYKFGWLNDSLVFSVINLEKGVEVTIYKPDTLTKVNSRVYGIEKDLVIRSIIGAFAKNLVLLDSLGNIIQLDISSITLES
jgi:hypothetical protein